MGTIDNVPKLKLRNGALVPEVTFQIDIQALMALQRTTPEIFRELVQLARNQEAKPSDYQKLYDRLGSSAFLYYDSMPPTSMLRKSIVDVILSGVEGEGAQMKFRSALAED